MTAAKKGRRKMNYPRSKYAAILSFVAALMSNPSEAAAPQELTASDIPKIIVTYYENKVKYNHDYLGKTFISTMFFDGVGGEAFGGGYFVGFDGINGSAGLTCSFSETLPHEVIDWEAGKTVSLTGIVYNVVLANLYLKGCKFE
jgi:hypothetical protein